MNCFQCQKEFTPIEPVAFSEECPFCRSDARVCKNCRHYDPQAYNECKEPQAERILEKERRNRCDFFSPRALGATNQKEKSAQQQLLEAAEALFKKNS